MPPRKKTNGKKQGDKKIYLLDTSVLLHSPEAIFSFRENDVVRAVASGQACTIGVTAQDIMNSCKHTCSPDTPEAELLEMMSEHHVQHLPVLSEGRLAGIVSLGDVVRLRREKIREMLSELEQLADHGRFTANLKRPRAGHPHLSMARAG